MNPLTIAELRELRLIHRLLKTALKNVFDAKHMGAFILGFCSIDWMTSYYYGRDSSRSRYKSFVRTFLPPYDAAAFYHDLRCGLVHNYTDKGQHLKYDFRERRPKVHLQLRPDKSNPKVQMKVLNLSSFRSDLSDCLRAVMAALHADPLKARAAIGRFRSVGLIAGNRETV